MEDQKQKAAIEILNKMKDFYTKLNDKLKNYIQLLKGKV